MTVAGAGQRSSRQSMKTYYDQYFPASLFHRWLAYGHARQAPSSDVTVFKRREFCFTLDGDIFVRYRSFQDAQELRAALKDKVPGKVDIGPIYSQDPAKRAAYTKGDAGGSGFRPLERELVFDIDLTDYDDVRNSSAGAGMSERCWSLMAAAIEVLDTGLREDFGFKHILWVYSGRRGIHAWVCDAAARRLTDEQRSAVAAYLSVYKGQEKGLPALALPAAGVVSHPFVDRAYAILLRHWNKVLVDQQLLTTERTRRLLLRLLPPGDLSGVEASVKALLRGAAEDGDDANVALWEMLCNKAEHARKQEAVAWRRALQAIVFACCYPRLDADVSKKMNHLLKAPFCVHPKTGNVCVPIQPSGAVDFNPEGVLTLTQLLEDDAGKAKMDEHLRYFEKDFLGPLERDCAAELLRVSREQNATSLAW